MPSTTWTMGARAADADPVCRICGHAGGAEWYRVPELMFGLGEEFDYFQCRACDCLQIASVPPDLGRFYPPEYWLPRGSGAATRWLRRTRDGAALFGRRGPGAVLLRLFPYPHPAVRECLAGRDVGTRILDVGCGRGELLEDLAAAGFRNLIGVDPYLPGDEVRRSGVRLVSAALPQISGEFDLIMFHHVLEHVPQQHETLAAAARLLAPGGRCLIRVPLASSWAWRHYRERWVQLDAPRHLFLHSARSLELLAAGAGLRLAAVEHDSTELQIWGSELYTRGVPLRRAWGRPGEFFSRPQMKRFRERAAQLNATGQGDQAAFVFTRGEAPRR